MRISKVQFEDSQILKEFTSFLSTNTIKQYKITLRQFLRFLASQQGLPEQQQNRIRGGNDLDRILEEFKSDVPELQH